MDANGCAQVSSPGHITVALSSEGGEQPGAHLVVEPASSADVGLQTGPSLDSRLRSSTAANSVCFVPPLVHTGCFLCLDVSWFVCALWVCVCAAVCVCECVKGVGVTQADFNGSLELFCSCVFRLSRVCEGVLCFTPPFCQADSIC